MGILSMLIDTIYFVIYNSIKLALIAFPIHYSITHYFCDLLAAVKNREKSIFCSLSRIDLNFYKLFDLSVTTLLLVLLGKLLI